MVMDEIHNLQLYAALRKYPTYLHPTKNTPAPNYVNLVLS